MNKDLEKKCMHKDNTEHLSYIPIKKDGLKLNDYVQLYDNRGCFVCKGDPKAIYDCFFYEVRDK